MLKKILITLFIVPVIAAAIYGYFHFKQIKTPLSPVIQAIPSDAAFILKCNTPKSSLQNFSIENKTWKSLLGIPFFGALHTDIRFLDCLFSLGSDALKTVGDKPLFISAHPDASNQYNLLYLINLPNTVSKKQVNDFILHATTKTANYNLRIYDGVALNEMKLSDTRTFYYFFNKGIFACTFSQFLMEDAIRQLNSGTAISADPAFDKVWNSAGKKVEATLFINYFNFSQILSSVMPSSESKFLKSFSSLANWTSLDIKKKGDAFSLNGFTFSKDTSNNYLTIFKGQETQEIEIAAQIPASTAYLQCYALSDVNRYFKNYDSYLNNLTDHYSRQQELTSFNKKYNVNAQNFFKQWMGNQFAYVITEPQEEDYNDNCYALIASNGKKEVAKIISDFERKINTSANPGDTLFEKFRNFELHHIASEALIPMVFGEAFEKIKNTYYVQLNADILVANSTAALKKWINAILAKHTLNDDSDYKSFAENLSSQSTLYFYTNLARTTQLLQHTIKKELLNWNDTKTETLQQFHAFALQLNADQNMFYTTAFAEYKPCYKKPTETILEIDLDTTVHQKPFILTDPIDSSKKIFVQDDANKIYLIDNSGKILWKKEMKEKIRSEVQSLRSNKYNELQILFSTKTKIHLLDESGEPVGKFPVMLKYQATNGVQAIDYDNNGEYRLLICEDNKRIYNYTHKGDAANGWEAVANADMVNAPIHNFRTKGLDYLIVLDQSGTVNLLDRKGKVVSKFKQKLRNVCQNQYSLAIENTLNASSILACDSTGEITRLYFSGKIEKSQPIKTPKEFYFNYIPSKKQCVFTSLNKLEIFDEAKTKIGECKLNASSILEPGILVDGQGAYQILIASEGQNLHRFASDGKKVSTIEAQASTAPTVCHFFGDASWYVAIGCGKKINVFAAY